MKRLFLILAVFSIGFALSASAAVFTSDAIISASNTNYDGEDIEVIGCTLTIDGSHAFSDVFIVADGIITHSPATNSADIGLNLNISNYLVIEAGSGIVADLLGNSPGGGGSSAGISITNSKLFSFPFASGTGGGYGGQGGASIGGAGGGDAYGSLQFPANAGSGGGPGAGAAPGGAGGGIVKLKIGGGLILDGRISADGGPGTNDASGGGSGGSISISSPIVSGAGIISANGGPGESSNGGGGGGGRITLAFSKNDFVGSVSAHGGDGAMAGGAGTIFSTGAKLANYLLLIDNGGLSGANTLVESPPYANMTIQGGAIAKISGLPFTLLNLEIRSNSWAVCGFQSEEISIQANNVIVETGGGFDFSGISTIQPAPGGGGSGVFEGQNYGGGGGHGGPGGNGLVGAGGGTSDSTTAPTLPGGNGGRGAGAFSNSAGGGGNSLKITATQTIDVEGLISADGQDGLAENSGGGAGGSIQLITSNFTGHGSVTANGGNAGSADGGGGGGGGGGRIAISYKTNTFSGTIAAHGGTGYQNGGPGTIYVNAGPAVPAQLTIDNAGLEAPPTLLPLGQGNVILTNAASATVNESPQWENLYISSNCYLICTNLNTIFAKQLVIETNGGIIADAVSTDKKFPESGATLTNTNGISSGGGGACAGFGGSSALGAAGGSPVFLSQPEDLASGAGGGGGGAGGGFFQINVEGVALVNGRISANGGAGKVVGSGGGGGGFMILNVNSLTGNGVISANGGDGQLPLGGGGGGGQVNLKISNTNLFAGTIKAYGGEGASVGGAGIITLMTNQGVAQITLDNNGRTGTNTFLIQYYGGLFDINVLNGAIADGPGIAADLRNLFVGSNSALMLPTNNPILKLGLLGNITVQAGGVISADGLGGTPTIGQIRHIPGGAGGSHGGLGGNGAGGPTSSANSESFLAPTLPGLGGQYPPGIPPLGGHGGGSLILSCGTLTLDGLISANGQPGFSEGCGGGAGGTVSIQAHAVTGIGSITANGGAGNLPYGGGGGGGRIAVNTINSAFTGTYSAAGGPGFNPGGAGTIYTLLNQVPGTLTIDNTGNSNGYTTLPQNVNLNLILTGNANALVSNFVSVGSLRLQSNSFLVATSTLPAITIEATGNVTIAAGCGISCDAVSHTENELGGSMTMLPNGNRTGGGGANGGNGGIGEGGAVAGTAPNESIIQPGSPGGVGGNGLLDMDSAPPALGGGAMWLSVKGTLQVDGFVTANGADATNEWGGGGAGGSVRINATSIAGSGKITANGGSGSLPNGGGGGGGRVGLSVATNSFAGSISAYGGEGFVAGGAGTVYVGIVGAPGATPNLIIDNRGLPGASTPLYDSFPALDLVVGNGAIVQPRTALSLADLFVESNAFIEQLTNHFQIAVSGNALVGPTAAILADGAGWMANSGTGAGTTASNYTSSGGGSGGAGGLSEGKAAGGTTNGSAEMPVDWGSGGGLLGQVAGFSQGGGAITLNVGGTLTLKGEISANGESGVYPGSGGGAGGSVWLTVGTLTGDGSIAADGGAAQDALGGGGGGGRIAIYSPMNEFAGSTTVNGGTGFSQGGVGTIYISTNKAAAQISAAPVSDLQISQPASPASLSLSWTGNAGVSYQVQSSADLIHWQPFGDVILGGTGPKKLDLTPATNSQQRYFRLVIVN